MKYKKSFCQSLSIRSAKRYANEVANWIDKLTNQDQFMADMLPEIYAMDFDTV